jgi:acyl carrier protein
MDLEGDLGIDSIKRVEILSAVAEKLPQAPKIKPEHLGTMRTLKAIVSYLSQGEAQAQPAPTTKVTVPSNNTLEVLAKVVADKTGYPAETINPDMDLEGDLGIDSIKRVEILSAVAEILPNAPKVKPEHLGTLRTLRALADYLGAEAKVVVAAPPVEVKESTSVSQDLQRQVLTLVPVGPRDLSGLDLTRTIAITRDSGLDTALAREMSAHGFKTQIVAIDSPDQLPADLGGLILVAPASPAGEKCPWNAESEAWLTKAFEMTQAAGRLVGTRGLIASVTRMDGALGLSGREFDPAFGGIAGLIKTAAREWEHMIFRAIDIDPRISLDAAARLLAKEISLRGPVETAISEAGIRTLELEQRLINVSQAVKLNPGDVVIVTGGARGVTAQAALAFAQQYKPTMVLIGRSPLPDQKSDAFTSAVSKTDLRREIAQKNKQLSPKDIAAQADAILAEREIRDSLKKLEDIGVKAFYRAVDIRDQAAVAKFVAQTQKEWGVIRGLVPTPLTTRVHTGAQHQ